MNPTAAHHHPLKTYRKDTINKIYDEICRPKIEWPQISINNLEIINIIIKAYKVTHVPIQKSNEKYERRGKVELESEIAF